MNNLKALRNTKGLYQKDIADLCNVAKSTYCYWEQGKFEPDQENLKKLADFYGVSIDYLLGRADDTVLSLPGLGIFPFKTKKVPLVGTIACGTPILAAQNVEGYLDMDESVHADFCLRCKGDSMINARIFDGDIVYIRQQDDVENGEIAAVVIDGEATLKRVYKYPNRLELRAENPTFPVINIEGSELATTHIIGKAVAFLSEVR